MPNDEMVKTYFFDSCKMIRRCFFFQKEMKPDRIFFIKRPIVLCKTPLSVGERKEILSIYEENTR